MHLTSRSSTGTAPAQRATSAWAGPSSFSQGLGPGWQSSVAPVAPLAPLTRREWEVLALLASGPSNRQLAGQLSISERTAEAHVANVLGKLGLANRAQAAAWAAHQGLAPGGAPGGPSVAGAWPVG